MAIIILVNRRNSMQGLTLQQLQQMGGTPVQPIQSTAPAQNGQGLSLAQIQQMGGTPNIPITPDLGQKTAQTFQQGGENIVNDIKNTKINTNVAENLLNVTKTAGHVAGDIAGTAGNFLGNIIAPLIPNIAKDKIAQISQAINDKVNQIPGMTPDIHKSLGDVVNTASLLGGEEAKPAIETTAEKGANAVKNTIDNFTKKQPMTSEEIQSNLKGVANDWAKPTTINEPKYNNARAVIEKNPDVPQTLAQNGIDPFSNIEDGKYNTEDTAQKLRDDNGKLSRDLLRPSLEVADKTVAPTSVGNFKPTITNTYGVTADDAETIRARLDNKLGALERKYPNGMSLTNMLDERITYDANGGYKAFKSNADNIDAIANRAIADSMRQTLIAKGDAAGIPVGDFQAELAKNYKAADYLDALHGKKAPISVGQSIARYGAKVIGAKAAGLVGGGDLVSEFVGYHIGGALEKFVENMTNPMRNSFLKNLKITNPEAFTKMEEYLKKNAPPK